jgi:glycosyltransferase involved in cell wall biosynthesis
MAAGKSVVTTDTGGVKEVVREGQTGFIVKPRDTKRLCERLDAILRDEALRRKMGEKARESLGDVFDRQKMVNNNRDLYEILIAAERS